MSSPRKITIRTILLIAFLGIGVAVRAFVFPPLRSVSKEEIDAPEPAPKSALEKPKPPSTDGFVNSQACAECHQEIYDIYQTHPMSKSLAALPDAPAIEDYEVNPRFSAPKSHRFKGRLSFYIERKNEEFFHHEVWTGENGKQLYDQRVPVHYEIGSGQRGRSYMIQRDSMLFMSPITWYSERKIWDYSPGYEKKDLRFERRVVDACLACHAGRVAADRNSPNHYDAREPFPEPSIGCERCHGPGKAHIEYRKNGEQVGIDPIVNPVNLEPRKRDSVCNQCHLSGQSRILRYGRTDFDFRPGDDLADTWIALVHEANVGSKQTTDAVSQVEQMMASRCYTQSQGKFGCISCHDPHSRPKDDELDVFYRNRCLNCHTKKQLDCSMPLEQRLAKSAADSCVQCHMPKLAASDVPHTSQTDHRVVKNPALDGAAKESKLLIFDDADKRLPELEINRALGLSIIRYAENNQDVFAVFRARELLAPVVEALPDDIESIEAMGLVYRQLNQREMARRMWNRVLRLDPNREQTLRHLAFLSHEDLDFDAGIGFSDRLIELNPYQFDHFGRKSHMLGEINRYQESIEAAHEALKINPSSHRIHEWLSSVYQRLGDQRNALKHRRMYDAVRPHKAQQ
jgi:predicted CXXCH cytochrome family protein